MRTLGNVDFIFQSTFIWPTLKRKALFKHLLISEKSPLTTGHCLTKTGYTLHLDSIIPACALTFHQELHSVFSDGTTAPFAIWHLLQTLTFYPQHSITKMLCTFYHISFNKIAYSLFSHRVQHTHTDTYIHTDTHRTSHLMFPLNDTNSFQKRASLHIRHLTEITSP